jgi:hypothetical protein
MKYPSTQRLGIAAGLLLLLSALAACNDQPAVSGNNTGGRGGSGAGGGGTSGGGSSGTGGGQGGAPSDAGFSLDLPPVGGMTGTDTGPAADERQCGLDTYNLVRVPPQVVLVLDRSSSMNRMPTGATMPDATLWKDARAAVDQVLMSTQSGIHWGLQLFPVPTGCQVAAAPEVPVKVDNYMPILMKVDELMTNNTVTGMGGTPTDTAVINATRYLQGLMSANPKYLVLATDGEPTCAAGSSVGNGHDAALAAITAAVTAGFKTYVIGIAISPTSNGHTTLNDMATAGGVPRNDAMFKYYPAGNRADLVAALNTITGQVTNCVFPLSRPPPVPDNVKVTVDGMRVEPSMTDGWSYTNAQMTAIQFNGPACEAIKTRMAQVSIVFGCPGVIIP